MFTSYAIRPKFTEIAKRILNDFSHIVGRNF